MKEHYLMQFFEYTHLLARAQIVSKPFSTLAKVLMEDLPDNPEKTVALRVRYFGVR